MQEKKDLEEKAARLGADVVANPLPITTTHIVAVSKDQKFRNHQNLDHDVIGHAWLSECWELKRHVPLEPKVSVRPAAAESRGCRLACTLVMHLSIHLWAPTVAGSLLLPPSAVPVDR